MRSDKRSNIANTIPFLINLLFSKHSQSQTFSLNSHIKSRTRKLICFTKLMLRFGIKRLLSRQSPLYNFKSFATTSSSPQLQDIVIIGGGPAGLSILAALQNSSKTEHLKCTLIEANSLQSMRDFEEEPPEHFTNRVVSLTNTTLEFMEKKLGNYDFLNHDRMKYYDGVVAYDSKDFDAKIRLDNDFAEMAPMGAMCEIANVQSSLLAKLNELKEMTEENGEECQFTILENTKVESIESPIIGNEDLTINLDTQAVGGHNNLDWPILTLSDGQQIQTRLLIGADGYNSPVRKFAAVESRGWSYNSFGIVGSLKLIDEPLQSLGYQRFLSTGPIAILPLPEDNATLVWSCEQSLAKILIKVNEELFPHVINAALVLDEVDLNYIYKMLSNDSNDESIIEEIKWRQSKLPDIDPEDIPLTIKRIIPGTKAMFPLKMAHSDTYIGPRVALVGDAAHTIHPLAGQGLNLGQRDVAALIEAIETGVDRGLDIGSLLTLEPYVSKTWPFNHAVLGACDKLHKVFSTNLAPIVWARGMGMKVMNNLGPVKEMMVRMIG